MKKSIYFIILVFCLLNAEEQNEVFMDHYRKVAELSWLGLSYCMGIGDKNEIKQELHELSLDPTDNRVKIMDSNSAFKDLQAYIDEEREVYEISKDNAKLSYKDFKACIKMFYYGTGYGSNYNFKVEQIIKKHCKDCK
ncbi:hypothetical protein [Campylobacter troglodytis]|uniref:hypothetical protein n=1 Tax=Campylobacter troglodytis TaxID=654363 RepID=UPI0011596FE2|nr:hypothetical protein [Campylobacter troglodytis]TQR50416.1 hypothetical protein DMC01_12800 [Campylobacter troglodytis]